MGRKKMEPKEKTLKLVEKEIEAATKEIKFSILRLVQAQIVWERITGTEILENACNCLLVAMETERKFKEQRLSIGENLTENV